MERSFVPLLLLLLLISLLSLSTAGHRHGNLSPPPPRFTVSSPPPPRSTLSSPPPSRSTLCSPPPPRSTLSSPPPPRSTLSSPPMPETTSSSMVHSFLGKIFLGIIASGIVYGLFLACRRFLVDLFEFVTAINNIFPIYGQYPAGAT